MKKSSLLLIAFVSLIMLSLAFDNAAKPLYKNLKVLPKNTTKEQMEVVMKHFTASLGVKCNHCHQFNTEKKEMDWASDGNKNKGVARVMMKMTEKTNKKYFKWEGDWTALKDKLEVTCYTCHGGKKIPSSWPVIQERPAVPPPSAVDPPAKKD